MNKTKHWEDLFNNSWVHQDYGLITKVKTDMKAEPYEFYVYPEENNPNVKFGPIPKFRKAQQFAKELYENKHIKAAS